MPHDSYTCTLGLQVVVTLIAPFSDYDAARGRDCADRQARAHLDDSNLKLVLYRKLRRERNALGSGCTFHHEATQHWRLTTIARTTGPKHQRPFSSIQSATLRLGCCTSSFGQRAPQHWQARATTMF
eukprot:2256028-Amphidinium_carterae.1